MIKITKKLFKIIIIFLSPIILYIILTIINMVYNNYFNYFLYKQINKEINLPENSEIIYDETHFGILWGNGNHCDTEIVFLVNSTKGIEKFGNSFYKENVRFKYKGENLITELYYIKNDDTYEIYRNGNIKQWCDTGCFLNNYNESSSGIDYIIRYTIGREAWFDIRCH